MSWLGLPPSGLGDAIGKASSFLDEFDSTAQTLVDENKDAGSREGETVFLTKSTLFVYFFERLYVYL